MFFHLVSWYLSFSIDFFFFLCSYSDHAELLSLCFFRQPKLPGAHRGRLLVEIIDVPVW